MKKTYQLLEIEESQQFQPFKTESQSSRVGLQQREGKTLKGSLYDQIIT